MSCCGMRGEETGGAVGSAALWARRREDGTYELTLSAPGIHCAACISTIEKGLKEIPELEEGRVNFTLRQVRVRWRDEARRELRPGRGGGKARLIGLRGPAL